MTASPVAEHHPDPAEFEDLANNIPVLCWMAEATGSIYWYSEQWYNFTGTTPEQMQGWGWSAVHHIKTIGDVLPRWVNCLATGERFEMIFPLRRADGAYIPFLTRVRPVLKDGKIVRWFGINVELEATLLSPSLRAEWKLLSAKMGGA